jgi:hypothetical protein
MKKKKMKALIQAPLRFHHQDIHEELDAIKSILSQLSFQVIEIKKEVSKLNCNTIKED